MALRTMDDLNLVYQRVLVRVDFNVPLDQGRITDDTRIRATLPTIQYLVNRQSKIVLVSHLGRPKGKVNDSLRMKPVAERLAEILDRPVRYVTDIIGPEARAMVASLEPGDIGLLENVRFDPGEEANDPDFAKKLASLADCYVNDAFGTAHRAHASTVGVAKLLPSAAGLLMQEEVEALSQVLDNAEHPYVLILGGAKVSDKVGVIEHLLEKVDTILIGGGMANTFLAAQGADVQQSLLESDKLDVARETLRRSKEAHTNIILPVDVVIADKLSDGVDPQTVAPGDIPAKTAIYDVGPKTVAAFAEEIAAARTVVWNGPMGVFEVNPFAAGTRGVAQAVAACHGYTLIGGGDSVAAVEQLGLSKKISHISTGGGASLEFLEGRELPGVAALSDGDGS